MTEKVKLGIIGYGAEGGMYAGFFKNNDERLNDNIELAAVCDNDPAKKAKVAEDFPGLPFFDNYLDLLESGIVNAIVTTVPHYDHCVMGIAALERGIHLLGEKPAGVYTKDVERLIETSKKHPETTFAIFFNQRTNPLYRRVKQLMDEKAIGDLQRATWIITTWWRPQGYYNQSAWRATWGGEGGGVLVNQAPHQLDLLQWICGKPEKVYAKLQYGAGRNIVVENEVNALLDFGNGATGSFITCTNDIVGTDRFEIFGTKGKIIVEDSKKLIVKQLTAPEAELSENMDMQDVMRLFMGQVNMEDYVKVTEEEFVTPQGLQHISVLNNFADHIVNGEPLLANGEEGINGVTLANAMHLSSWLDKEVDYNVDGDLYLAELNKRIAEEGKFEQKK
ncbi:MAG: Gfo/Idh/MocA family oxidoreductase [Trichococcus flocculiformis]|uniref:Gfo/Idh/MocA family oxidoreductase n=1 Tax=Trichococcus flocculiformis TaxID=82803 RepID=A0A847D8M4_9LACT|nr:Gfo/Idh/MocA family oxidoreductase [Trichococcus flocculiformis]MBP6246497.1 Gfo/Idh/MocA family oxidoreductase [Trichococcus sp.]NCB66042.1 Gfo/Idh/MocA family oxidoreductase [Bacilli bacterium]MBP9977236.1 Gfo/Idh/MocA family oxidoreductase [Trichococcus sp.]NLD33095.1 Gfo/Idh/MocA family oxidoreductase [Trichococcus flocculiformis]HAZ58781.1 gfo/Idh/MocA family oxidoreductase [Trichococcus sp.]